MSVLPPKYASIRVRMTVVDRDVLVLRAQRAGVTLSAVIRQACLEFIQRRVEKDRIAAPVAKRAYPHSSDGQEGL